MTQIVDMAAFRGPTAQMVDLSKFTFWGPPQDMDFFYKQSTRTGRAWLRSIHGRTVSYNQLVVNGDFSDGKNGWNGTGSVTNGIYTVSWPAQYSNNGIYQYLQQIRTIIGHKYYVRAWIQNMEEQARSFYLGIPYVTSDRVARIYAANEAAVMSGIYTATGASTADASGNAFKLYSSVGSDASIKTTGIMVVDLTQAGLDSIITTPAEFEAWQMEQFGHTGYLGYTLGTLVSVNPTGVKTTTPGGDEHTLPLDFTEHFPAGVNGLNGIYDEVVSDENGKFTDGEKRFGIVDLGTLAWTKLANKNVFRASLSDAKAAANNYAKANVICPNYYTDATDFVEANIDGIGINTGKLITVGDDRYTNPADFKTAMDGVPLIYELAAPQHVTFTDPSDAVYPVTDGGTEQVLPVNGSEPTTGPLLGKVSYKQGRSAQ